MSHQPTNPPLEPAGSIEPGSHPEEPTCSSIGSSRAVQSGPRVAGEVGELVLTETAGRQRPGATGRGIGRLSPRDLVAVGASTTAC
jgi:hypothetical protein